jgi:hypothetical protein
MKTERHIKDLQKGIRALALTERDGNKKKVYESFILVFEYVVNDKMTLPDLEKAIKNAMR